MNVHAKFWYTDMCIGKTISGDYVGINGYTGTPFVFMQFIEINTKTILYYWTIVLKINIKNFYPHKSKEQGLLQQVQIALNYIVR